MKHLDSFSIANVGHSSYVTRWHSVDCHSHQSIADHQYKVTMFARYLASVIDPNMSTKNLLDLTDLCLLHDLPEVLTGDMATPLKRWLEARFPKGESPIDLLEEKLCAPYAAARDETRNTYIAVIAKLADIMDAIYFIGKEGKGRVAQKIYAGRMKAFDEYLDIGRAQWPKYSWSKAKPLLNTLLNDDPDQIDYEEIIHS